MNVKPIIFNADMVRALLDGRKTQTRRPCKDESTIEAAESFCETVYSNKVGRVGKDNIGPIPTGHLCKMNLGPSLEQSIEMFCPHGQVGDLLYVRETFENCNLPEDPPLLAYRADTPELLVHWKPSIHMPRWASRLTLRITDVCVERVQDITRDDCVSEGIELAEDWAGTKSLKPFIKFKSLWNSIYNNWNDNPWVWVIEFEVIHKNVDEVLE